MFKTETDLYCCEQIRYCEQQAVDQYDMDECRLMSQAGMEAFFFIKGRFSKIQTIAVFCGKGNNAGDGYAFARLAHEQGLSVIVYQCCTLDDLSFEARDAATKAMAAGVECQSADEPLDSEVELIIDALLGIGIQGPVHGQIALAISQINSSGLPVVSLDLPSGLQADTGQVENICVRANITLTFIALKPGLFTLDGPDYCGEVIYRSLQMDHCIANLKPYAHILTYDCLPLSALTRKKNSHKGLFGHVLVIGGGHGMPGAVGLTAKAALRAGAGCVTIATLPSHVSAISPYLPEAMIFGIKTVEDLQPLLARASICVIGPGLGESEWATALFLAAISSQLPMVIDACALSLLQKHAQMDDNWILTPHPGEAATLLSCSVDAIQSNRYQTAAAIQSQYGGVVVLKGAGSLIHTPEKATFVCIKGNPGLSSAGMGDALSGIIAGLCAQGLSLSEGAKLGVWIHACAGDAMARAKGEIGLTASDLIEHIPVILNGR
ncbi:MAG: NAD(P)H-hydrate dehydratase [Legionella sp.]|nr:NAD(P)H-hydrate dehydratase [Legionella sp.]